MFIRLQSPIELHARPNNSIACIRKKMTSSLESIKGTALEHQITPGEDTTKTGMLKRWVVNAIRSGFAFL